MTPVLLTIHSIVRWLLVLVALFALIKFTWGWLRGGSFNSMDRGLSSGFSGLMDLQATIGLVILLWNGLIEGAGFPRYRLEHLGMMILAVVIAHLPSRWKNAADSVRFRNSLLCILGALIFVYFGVAALPGGWMR